MEPDSICLTDGPCQVYGDYQDETGESEPVNDTGAGEPIEPAADVEPVTVEPAPEIETVRPQITAASNGRLF